VLGIKFKFDVVSKTVRSVSKLRVSWEVCEIIRFVELSVDSFLLNNNILLFHEIKILLNKLNNIYIVKINVNDIFS